jgi:hypothetical protein
MSKIVDSLKLFATDKRAYVQHPLTLELDEKITKNSDSIAYSSEYILSWHLGYKIYINDSVKDLLPSFKQKMLDEFAMELFGEFRPILFKLFELAYKNGDRNIITLLEELERRMFKTY